MSRVEIPQEFVLVSDYCSVVPNSCAGSIIEDIRDGRIQGQSYDGIWYISLANNQELLKDIREKIEQNSKLKAAQDESSENIKSKNIANIMYGLGFAFSLAGALISGVACIGQLQFISNQGYASISLLAIAMLPGFGVAVGGMTLMLLSRILIAVNLLAENKQKELSPQK